MNDLTNKEFKEMLPEKNKKQYNAMIKNISSTFPEMRQNTNAFLKSQSQFMDNVLTVSHPTPYRNIRQILAESERTVMALKENQFKVKEKEINLDILERNINKEEDHLQKKLLELNKLKLMSEIEETKRYMLGAIRKLSNYSAQYKNLMKTLGKKDFSEIDFEAEEERYHIMKAFDQALSACRSRGGVIDEGNLIYFSQIGINGTLAHKEIIDYFMREQNLLKANQEPTKTMEVEFLNKMAEKFKGCAREYCKIKGFEIVDENSILR